MTEQFQTKAAVSVTEMAAMVNLSRERFYQLIGTAFPYPQYDIRSRRPFYTVELQEVCRIVRESNCGVDGRPVLFYSRRGSVTQRPSRPSGPSKTPPKDITEKQYPDILAAVKALGLTTVTSEEITAAVLAVFPQGIEGMERGKVIRGVFVRLKRHGQENIVA